MNHRIKNNLIMVESLIHLKQRETGNRVDLSDIEYRIDTIRILHEKLYKTGDVLWIDLKEYLGDIAGSVFSTLAKSGRIDFENKLITCRIETKSAVALGLIVNELASNTIKYAQPGDGSPVKFSISLHTDTCTGTLTVSNSGPPLPEGLDVHTPKTLGLRLISILVQQLDGDIAVTPSPHPVFTIRFPHSKLT